MSLTSQYQSKVGILVLLSLPNLHMNFWGHAVLALAPGYPLYPVFFPYSHKKRDAASILCPYAPLVRRAPAIRFREKHLKYIFV